MRNRHLQYQTISLWQNLEMQSQAVGFLLLTIDFDICTVTLTTLGA